MKGRSGFHGTVGFLVGFAVFLPLSFGQNLVTELKAERDPAKRIEKALDLADDAFDHARASYTSGDVHKGDEQLDNMTAALNECVISLDAAHKAKYYKKAELKIAFLQRRMQGLVDDISVNERGWADYTDRKLDEIHDKVLNGVMRK
jgi:hypothetical protein